MDPQDPFAGGFPPPPGSGAPDAGFGAPPSGFGGPAYDGPGAGGAGMPALAEWPARVAAALIDGVIAFVAQLVVGFVSKPLGQLVGLAIFVYLQYRQGTTGRTPGKEVMKIRLLREQDGQVVGFGNAVLRAIVHIVDALPCLLGYLWPLWDAKKQTFADKIMKTVVVKG